MNDAELVMVPRACGQRWTEEAMTDYKKLCEDLGNCCMEHNCTKCSELHTSSCVDALMTQSKTAIEELQAERDKWVKLHNEAALNWQESARWIGRLEAENEQLKRELEEEAVERDTMLIMQERDA